MKTILFSLIATLSFIGGNSQISYSGTVDAYAIDVILEVSGDSIHGGYSYQGSGEPIALSGKIVEGTLFLNEKDKAGKNLASVSFTNFTTKNEAISGTWTNLKSNKTYSVALKKIFEVILDTKSEWQDVQIMQLASLENSYFKLHVSKAKGKTAAKVIGVSIYAKETHTLLQKIVLDCDYHGLNSVSTGDFNFDGHVDFSVFKQNHGGPNTTSVYFLYDTKSKTFIDSGYTGTSLRFDSQTKHVIETKLSKAGDSKLITEYNVVHNKMVVLSSHCFLLDEKAQEFIERPIKECN